MNKLKANIVDLAKKSIYFGEITFDSKVRDIKKLSDTTDNKAPFVAPGFIDSHVHIESSLCTPQRFAQMVAEYGTIACICDPHEITNVLGEEGFNFMLRDAQHACIKLYFATPSCVPATSFETNGAEFGLEETRRALQKSVALAEMMNYPGVVFDDPTVMAKIALAKEMSKPIDGHCPTLSGDGLKKYVAAGISTDHECFSLAEAKEKISLGMMIQIREGSAARNYAALHSLLSSNPENTLLCTDDAHPDDILYRGHINKFFRLGVKDCIDIFNIYQAALLNPIKHYNLTNVGTLQVGEQADFVVLENLETFEVKQTYIDGKKVFDINEHHYQIETESAINNMTADYHFTASDFEIKIKSNSANVIECFDGELITKKFVATINQPIDSDYQCNEDIIKIAVVNRYQKQPISLALIKGTGLKFGAIGCSIAHDSHNVVIIGCDNQSMAQVAQTIFNGGGGIAATNLKENLYLPLPYAGLMDDKYYRESAAVYSQLVEFAKKECGANITSPFMTMAFMPLLVIPELKLSDKGLFDSTTFKFINLFN